MKKIWIFVTQGTAKLVHIKYIYTYFLEQKGSTSLLQPQPITMFPLQNKGGTGIVGEGALLSCFNSMHG
jgi:hypothetical protein